MREMTFRDNGSQKGWKTLMKYARSCIAAGGGGGLRDIFCLFAVGKMRGQIASPWIPRSIRSWSQAP